MVDEKKKKAGEARWIGVSEEKKKSLVSKAAHARWKQADVRIAEHTGEIDLGGITLKCAVLDDARRVLSERGVSAALHHDRAQADYDRKLAAAAEGAEVLPGYMPTVVAQFLPVPVRKKLASPIRYRVTKGFGIPAIGVEATLLADICEAFLAAREAGVLQPEDLPKAAAADKLMRALARVAIVALVDEATGFQVVRDRDELQQLLAKYVAEEHRPWVSKFPNEYYIELFRLRGISTADVRKRPQYFGHLTNDIVYKRLVPGMLPRLDEVNPANEQGRRSHKHHQHLLAQGEQHLKTHLAGIVYLMKASSNWKEFIAALDRVARKQDEVPDE